MKQLTAVPSEAIGSFIGKNLTICRKKLDITQLDLSIKSGVPVATISNIEQRRNDFPNVDTLSKLTAALNIPVGLFLLLAEEDYKCSNVDLPIVERKKALQNKILFENLISKYVNLLSDDSDLHGTMEQVSLNLN